MLSTTINNTHRKHTVWTLHTTYDGGRCCCTLPWQRRQHDVTVFWCVMTAIS